jgi:hypothetical protein
METSYQYLHSYMLQHSRVGSMIFLQGADPEVMTIHYLYSHPDDPIYGHDTRHRVQVQEDYGDFVFVFEDRCPEGMKVTKETARKIWNALKETGWHYGTKIALA